MNMRKDFLQFLLELHENEDSSESSLSTAELKAMITDTVLGATDTTATTVEWLMAEILSHPEAMRKVYEELNEVVGPNNSVEEFHLSKLTYMNAETFRLHPPLPFLLPRYPSKSTTIGGYSIPKGTKIFLNVWAIQRDPNVWENPNEFIPERFLTDDGTSQVHFNQGNNFVYMPFGSGRRMCAGVPLAERIVIYLLASFLHFYDWQLPQDEKPDLSDKFGIVVKKRDTLIAIPKPRLSNPELYN
ncbi:Cytochrome P450, E-class, group I [Parasponia andersonii]|uniref:Cytochrome P450, E-class, group I n=1 Tax=Parasponia andersonii TaxID=3476 RepID=A0A2P5BYC6_PARAD|nr:Cytochrome P450, E-class, group I [Parasponia andersonii]